MIIDLQSTSTSAVNRTLVEIREQGGSVALGRVLNLIICADDFDAEGAIEAANSASRDHPCRVLVIARGPARGSNRLDAQIRIGGDAGASEVIVLRTFGELTKHSEALVTPLLLPDTPVVTWWPGDPPVDLVAEPLGRIAQRRVSDSARAKRPRRALAKLAASHTPGDTDLAWSRISRWRSLLASALDQAPYEPVTKVVVTGATDSPSTELLAGWLAMTLKADVEVKRTAAGTGVVAVELHRASGVLELNRPERSSIATLTQPGQPERTVSLARRQDDECIAEELRRLDPDDVYGDVVTAGLKRVDPGLYGGEGAARSGGRSSAKNTARKPPAKTSTARTTTARTTTGKKSAAPRTSAARSTAAAKKSSPAKATPAKASTSRAVSTRTAAAKKR
ncbi:MAG: glucose-6-phosphate dehydrogenase assembly protein OpcA [Actinomycetales bacterium]